ncbi:hypothetical protein V4D30_01635 [Thermodesulfovibrio sp. 3907-1M]|uniref:Uncharacterized protein n=1 Tax=Thermodesulfovibrio autotrophicus TaxID=3118333 RepID=A0AAU8GWS9_9BACT
MSITQGILKFQLITEKSREVVTSFAGLPLAIETMKAMKIPKLIAKNLKIKKRETGKYSESDYIESLLSLFISGGECIDDIERLRSDEGLKELGLKFPSAESARFFLYGFHDEEIIKQKMGRIKKSAFGA